MLLCDAVPTTELTNRKNSYKDLPRELIGLFMHLSLKPTPSRHIPPHRRSIEHGRRFLRELNLRLTLEDAVFLNIFLSFPCIGGWY